VLLNSAAWGQSDSLYAALAVWSLVALARNRYTPAVGLLTAAMTLKLQAIFIAPVFLGFLFARRIRIRHLWPVPIIYACSVVPALLAGRPLASIFTIYFAQMVQYRALSYYLPNVYQFFEAGGGAFMGWIGIAIAGILTLGIALSTAKTLTRSALFFPSALIMVTLTATLALPFFLPHMHERYFYLAEALAIAYACIMTSRWFVPLLLIAMTSYTYLFILFLRMFPPPSFFPTAALLVAILLFRVGLDSVVMLTKTAATPTHPPRSGGG
jgi:Gpi18-like mannosyltransferase